MEKKINLELTGREAQWLELILREDYERNEPKMHEMHLISRSVWERVSRASHMIVELRKKIDNAGEIKDDGLTMFSDPYGETLKGE